MRPAVRAIATVVGLLLLWIGLSMAVAGLAADALRSPDSTGSAGTAVAIVGVVLLAGGYLLELTSFPALTALCGLIAAVLALAAADALWVTSAVVRHTQPDSFDPARAADDATLGAVMCLLIAAGCFAAWLALSRRRGTALRLRRGLPYIAVGFGALLFLSGLLFAFRTAVAMFQVDDVTGSALSTAVLDAGQAVLFGVPGAVLLWHGAGALTGVKSGRLHSPSPWAPLALAAAAIALGALLLQGGTGYALIPLAHAVAVIAPAAGIVALVVWAGRRSPSLARTTWRDVLLMGAYGAAVAATIAGLINTAAIATAFLLRLAVNGAFDGISTYSDFQQAVQNAGDYLSKSELAVLLLLTIAVIGPLNEEFWKGFGVRLLRHSQPTRFQAFLFGVASGVGFGIAEAQEYGFAAFHSSPYRWWDAMLVRGGTSTMHALASGMVGLAWFSMFQGKRLRALGLYLTAVGLHGSWNALNTLVAARVFPGFSSLSDRTAQIVLEAFAGVVALGLIALLCRLSAALASDEAGPITPPAPPPLAYPAEGSAAALLV